MGIFKKKYKFPKAGEVHYSDNWGLGNTTKTLCGKCGGSKWKIHYRSGYNIYECLCRLPDGKKCGREVIVEYL